MSQRTPRQASRISFDVSDDEAAIIRRIALRAHRAFAYNLLDTQMDITATHRNGNPLRLEDLLKADKFNFAHDVGGVARHLDRDTGKLMNHFHPRFSVPSSRRAAA
ncbi:hypothetical protein [Tardiphaga robiniae]|uniref:DUF6874 family protein n=1 Tax=Tardiphaga robiniae TaxID=943830 RepID=UPI001586451A|nr:hypothetical protein [Tardiphaga robiniae]NUU41409.1 hypothetical protein [Tardiphaga robiniae]